MKKRDAVRIDDMHKETSRLRIAGSIFVAILMICSVGAYATVKSTPPGETRADILTIETLKTFGPLERGPVEFFHDKHTLALEKTGKDCSACHLKEANGDRLSIKFMRLSEEDKTRVMDLYHANCIGCHNQMMRVGGQTGPVICAGCHAKQPRAMSGRQPIGMNLSLHARHEKAMEKKCEKCHHVYDEKAKKLVYEKGKEGTCRYCHGQMSVENRLSMRLASHTGCVACHLDLQSRNKTSGPVQCGGCHELKQQQKIEVVADPPRMEMKQPDTVFVKTGLKQDDVAVRMSPVAFNHQGHEKYNDNCRVCHHAALSACSECHTISGKKEGKGVNLEQSMHRKNSNASCVGCHTDKQKDKSCAGCHAFMSSTLKMSDAECRVCHIPRAEGDAPVPSDEKMAAELAGGMLAARKAVTTTLPDHEIPETVEIKSLVDKYQPVSLPHRKIVLKLAAEIKDNKLANYFHADVATLCQGCHHNSPVSKKPPQCGSCHGTPFDDRNPYRPGLMAAYHQQCMGCHDEMGIQKPANTDCVACHKEK